MYSFNPFSKNNLSSCESDKSIQELIDEIEWCNFIINISYLIFIYFLYQFSTHLCFKNPFKSNWFSFKNLWFKAVAALIRRSGSNTKRHFKKSMNSSINAISNYKCLTQMNLRFNEEMINQNQALTNQSMI